MFNEFDVPCPLLQFASILNFFRLKQWKSPPELLNVRRFITGLTGHDSFIKAFRRRLTGAKCTRLLLLAKAWRGVLPVGFGDLCEALVQLSLVLLRSVLSLSLVTLKVQHQMCGSPRMRWSVEGVFTAIISSNSLRSWEEKFSHYNQWHRPPIITVYLS